MPQTTPEIKVDAVRALGAEVVLAGDSYADAQARCGDAGRGDGLTFVHPFDDPLVIAGQGTVGAEILRQSQGRSGRGLRAGRRRRADRRASAPTSRRSCPTCGSSAWSRSKPTRCTGRWPRAGAVTLDHVGIFADGVAVRRWASARSRSRSATVDEVVRVTNDEICAAIKDVFDDTRTSWSRRARWRSRA